MKQDGENYPVYRAAQQLWFRPALALLLSVPSILPGALPVVGMSVGWIWWLFAPLIGVNLDNPNPSPLVAMLNNFAVHAFFILPLGLAISGYRRAKRAVRLEEAPPEYGHRCVRIARAAIIILAISVSAGTVAAFVFPGSESSFLVYL